MTTCGTDEATGDRRELATVCAPAISEQGKWLGRPRLLKLPRRAERLRECCGGKKILLRLNSLKLVNVPRR